MRYIFVRFRSTAPAVHNGRHQMTINIHKRMIYSDISSKPYTANKKTSTKREPQRFGFVKICPHMKQPGFISRDKRAPQPRDPLVKIQLFALRLIALCALCTAYLTDRAIYRSKQFSRALIPKKQPWRPLCVIQEVLFAFDP